VNGTTPAFARAQYDERGAFREGRAAEIAILRRAGYKSASSGRILEGHFNGVLLAALFGTREQRAQALDDSTSGHIFGVWNTQDGNPVSIHPFDDGFVLHGSKTWASGAGSVSRPIVTARTRDGRAQMCLVRMERVEVAIDASAWKPLGMEDSNSFSVSFDGVRLDRDDLIGAPGDYERQPWFGGGALRFVAVQTGIVERLFDETASYVRRAGRQNDAMPCARIGTMRIGLHSAFNWLDAGVAAWEAFDSERSAEAAERVTDLADMARLALERIALDAIEGSVRSVGARGLIEPQPFPSLIRDLEMYLRQPAPDAALLRVASSGLRASESAKEGGGDFDRLRGVEAPAVGLRL